MLRRVRDTFPPFVLELHNGSVKVIMQINTGFVIISLFGQLSHEKAYRSIE